MKYPITRQQLRLHRLLQLLSVSKSIDTISYQQSTWTWWKSLKSRPTLRRRTLMAAGLTCRNLAPNRTRRTSLKILTSQWIDRMRGLTCIFAGSTCGVELYGSRTKRSNSSARISSYKSLVSWRPKVSASLTLRSSISSSILATNTECLKWLGAFTTPCDPAASCQATLSLDASSIIKRKSRNPSDPKMQWGPRRILNARSDASKRKAMTTSMPRIESTYSSGKKSNYLTPLRSSADRSATLLTSASARSRPLIRVHLVTKSIVSKFAWSSKKNAPSAKVNY